MRIVVKVGTNVLTGNSYKISHSKVKNLIEQIAKLRKLKHEVILVSSGAIGSGREQIPNLDIPQKKQVWAAVGQPLLMHLYSKYALKKSMPIGQCLLLRNHFTDRELYDNFIRTAEGLLVSGALPIINENDVIATADLTVGDNDMLAAQIAVALKADRLVLLTNQKGVFTGNPDTDKTATLIEDIENIDAEMEKNCTDEVSMLGRGGMLSKVRSTRRSVGAGIETYIVDGRDSDILKKLFSRKKKVGTKFSAVHGIQLDDTERWQAVIKSL